MNTQLARMLTTLAAIIVAIILDGLDGRLIDFGKERECPARDLIIELIDWFIRDVVDELGSRAEVEYAYRILENGSSADRQLAVYRETGDLRAVVDSLVRETEEGVVQEMTA
mgnify:CR=1 FL=1